MSVDANKARSIFLTALEKYSPDRWPDYLDEACAGDADLRRRAEVLLQAHVEAGSLPDRPGVWPALTVDQPPPPEGPGAVIGPYKLLQQLGEGGMGAVFLAEQSQPVQRKVALKIIKPDMGSRQAEARFEAERQALALMDHPNIARVLDGGTTDSGRPYFVMELVKGVPIVQYCDEHKLGPRQRLELFTGVCQAVQHAHQKGIIHRDIKPSNVLVALYDDRPAPKVIDFGVAKATGQQLTDKTLVTGFGAIVGTLEYMSPEQAGFDQLDVDTRSDVYSLGVLLYELLTGTTPLERKRCHGSVLDLLRVIREEEPPRPSARLSTTEELPRIAATRGLEPRKLCGLVRGELDWVVMKALEKDRNRRYESAGAFSADVRRYLADEPVLACPPSVRYRLGKFSRRNRTGLGVAGLVLVFLVLLGGLVGWMAGDRAVRRDRLADNLAGALNQVEQYQDQGKRAEARAALNRAEQLAAEARALSPALSQRLAALKERLDAEDRDHDFIDRFENIRLEVQTRVNVEGNHYSDRDSFPALKKALGDYGIDVGSTAPAQAVARIQGRPPAVQAQLLAALGECSRCAPETDVLTNRWLNEVLTTAERDPWRRGAWQALAARDWTTLGRLVRAVDVRQHPPSLLLEVAPVLDRPTCLALVRSIQRAHPHNFWANHHLARELERNGRPAEAVRYYTAALAVRPNNAGTYLNRGIALRKAREWDGAVADLHQALTLAPLFAAAHNELFATLKSRGDVDGTLTACRRAVDLLPEHAPSYLNLGIALDDKGDVEGAITAYRRAIALWPQFAEAHSNLGLSLLARGDKEAALAAQHRAVAAGPKLPDPHVNLAFALLAREDPEGALAAAARAVRLGPNRAGTYFPLSHVLKARGDAEGRIAALRRALDLDPEYPRAHFNLGLALQARGDHQGAIAAFRRALDLEPRFALGHYNLGRALRDNGDAEGAISAYRRALAIAPDYPEAHCNLGHMLFDKGEYGAALAAVQKGHELGSRRPGWPNPSAEWLAEYTPWAALEARLPALLRGEDRPKDLPEKIDFAQLCARKGYSAAAARLNQEALAANPGRAGLRYQAACAAALAGCGRGKDAGQLEDRERARWRKLALAWLRADLELQRKRLETSAPAERWAVRRLLEGWKRDLDLAGVRGPTALAWLPEEERAGWSRLWLEAEVLIERAPGAQGHAALGRSRLAQGKFAEAEEAFRKAVRLRPEGPELHRLLGEALFRLDRRAEAVPFFARARALRPDDPWEWYFEAVARLGAGDVDGYKNVCRAMLERFGNTRDRATALRVLYACVTIPDAVGDSARLVPLAEFGAPFWKGGARTVGAALYRAGRHEEAVRRFAEAAQEARRSAWDWYFLALAHHRLGHADEAGEALRKGTEAADRAGQGPAVAWYARVEEERLRREAEALLGRPPSKPTAPAPPFRPKAAAAHAAALGDVLRRHGQPAAAATEYGEAIRLEPDFADARTRLRAVLAQTGSWQEAIAERQANLRRIPHDASAHNDLAWLLATCVGRNHRNPARAVRLAGKAVQIAPREGTYWNTLGVAQYRAGDGKAAVAALEKALALREGGDSFDWFFLAMAWRQLGQKQEARKWYDRASAWRDRYQPWDDELLRFQGEAAAALGVPGLPRGNFHADQGDCEQAAADYAQAFTREAPADPMVWMRHAHLRLRVGDRAGYRELCAKMQEKFGATENIDAFALLTHTCVLGPDGLEAAAALRLAERRFAMTPAPSVHHVWSFHVLGLAYYRAGEDRKAVDCLTRGLKKYWYGEQEVLNWPVLAMAHHRLGHTAEARKWFDRTEQWIENKSRLAEKSGSFAPPGWEWSAWLGARQLHQEARELLNQQPEGDERRPGGQEKAKPG
jgi:tetratricopeptide (TPR) repeat protein